MSAAAGGGPAAPGKAAVFLDRDGTLILNDGDLGDPDRVELLPHAASGVRLLRDSGYTLVVVTNQGGVARGRYDEPAVHATHERLERLLRQATGLDRAIDAFYFCPFHPEGTVERYRREHAWRKPQPGMLLAAATEGGLDLARSWMVGDQERDAAAGAAAGCRSVLLGSASAASVADFFAPDLHAAARRILHEDAPRVSAGVVTLHAAEPGSLADRATRLALDATARALAERTGVRLVSLEWTADQVTATVEGAEVIALGFAAEWRRTTSAWWRSRGESGSLWAGS